jgi:hypothetical protein
MRHSIFLASDPVTILQELMDELRWQQRMLAIENIEDVVASVGVPRNPNYLMAQTVEIRLRWWKVLDQGRMRCGANMPRFSDTEVHLLSRSALKERMENWFVQVLERV